MSENIEETKPTAGDASAPPEPPKRAPNPDPTPRMVEGPALSTLPGAPVKLKDGEAPPEAGTLLHWSLKHRLPAWLHAAMSAGRAHNAVLSEADALQLAREIAGLPLGRKVS